MKKFLLWGYFLFSGIPLAWGGLFITHTPAFEGVVIDSDTGKPIANAIISVQWYKAVLDFHGGVREIGEPQLVVTDENGKYRIIGKYWWAVLGVEGCRLRILHPYYDELEEHPIYGENFRRFRQKYERNEQIIYDAQLSTLRDRRAGDIPINYLGKGITLQTKKGDVYVSEIDFLYLKGIKKLKIDLKDVIPNWEEYSQRKGAKSVLEVIGYEN